MNRSLSLLLACSFAAAVGCYTGSATDTNAPPDPPSSDVDATDPGAKTPGKDGGAKNAVADTHGLPCDVAAIVTNACGDCHGATPAEGAKNRLVSYADFTAPSKNDPSMTVADVALARMKSASRPMPPDEKLAAATIGIFQKWVDAGLPMGKTCDSAPAADDGAGLPTDPPTAALDAGPPPVSVCTSGRAIPTTDDPTELMSPGTTCIACHRANADQVALQFEIAGTVYPTMHEPDSCAGASGYRILIIDGVGNVHTIDTNANGNFMIDTTTPIPRPYRAMVIHGSDMKQMKTPQTDGDCNGCHTEWGTGAPGRVRTP